MQLSHNTYATIMHTIKCLQQHACKHQHTCKQHACIYHMCNNMHASITHKIITYATTIHTTITYAIITHASIGHIISNQSACTCLKARQNLMLIIDVIRVYVSKHEKGKSYLDTSKIHHKRIQCIFCKLLI